MDKRIRMSPDDIYRFEENIRKGQIKEASKMIVKCLPKNFGPELSKTISKFNNASKIRKLDKPSVEIVIEETIHYLYKLLTYGIELIDKHDFKSFSDKCLAYSDKVVKLRNN